MEKRKGIILAGGKGSRLYPMTKSVNKQLQSVYDKPMIYYPLTTLINAGIRDILLITTQDQIGGFIRLFENGKQYGLNIEYAIQDEPKGIADAFLIAERVGFLKNDSAALVLGDNLFYGDKFNNKLEEISNSNQSTIFGYRVSNPEEYGVVEFNHRMEVISIEEKPFSPKSNYAVPGLYFYDDTVVDRVKELKPSHRNELEITDLNNSYIETGMNVEIIKDSAAWFDTGNAEQMFEAAMFVKSIQSHTGQNVGCLEEVCYNKRFIDCCQFTDLISNMPDCQYKWYLKWKYLEGVEVA